MTNEDIFKTFLEDPLLIEKGYIKKEMLGKLKIVEQSEIKLIEVIRIAINSNMNQETENVTTRKINQYLNK